MRRRRIAAMVGLTVVSGGLLVACAGAPRMTLPTPPTNFGIGILPIQMPALQAPAIGPITLDKPLVNKQAPTDATAPMKTNASATDQTGASTETGAHLFGSCPYGG